MPADSNARGHGIVRRKKRVRRKRGRLVHDPVGEAGVRAAAARAGIVLPRKFGL